MLNKSFIRGLWGNCCFDSNDNKSSVKKDIDDILSNEFTESFHTYVFGTKNYDYLKSLGVECSLINSEPVIYDMETKMWRHKLDIFKQGMKDFDEIVFMDWDCKPTKKLPDDFWDKISLKSSFQANLLQYRTKRCLWRKEDWRKTCNGGFVYISDKSIPDKIINLYNNLCKWVEKQKIKRESQGKDLRFREKAIIFDDEPAMSKYVDEFNGEWKGEDYYWQYHEPIFCNIKKSVYSEELLKTKEECFRHWV